MYKEFTSKIKISDLSKEIPSLSDFSTNEDVLFNSADGFVYNLVPKTIYVVKRTKEVSLNDIGDINVKVLFDKESYTEGDKIVMGYTVENAISLQINDFQANTSNFEQGTYELQTNAPGVYVISILAQNGDVEYKETIEINVKAKGLNKYSAVGDTDIEIVGKAIYIDTSYVGTEMLGTIEKPYNSWARVPKTPNTTYLFKRNTIIETSTGLGEFLNIENVRFGAYGFGNLRPIIRANAVSGNNFFILSVRQYNNADLAERTNTKISGLAFHTVTPSLCNGLRLGSNSSIENCYINGGVWGWRETGARVGDPNRIKNVSIKNSVIENTLDDGIFIQNVDNIEIDNVNVIKSNQNWAPGVSQSIASGDGIQLNGVTKISIKNTLVDRSDTGNKFCIIISGVFQTLDNYVIIDNNTLKAPKKTDQGGATLYISDIQDSELDIIFTNNELKGEGPNSLTGVWYQGYEGSFVSENNMYEGLSFGIQNISKSLYCTSKNDTFVNCGRDINNVQIL